MSAPAALALAKLSYPETQSSKSSDKDFEKLEKAYVVFIVDIYEYIIVTCVAFSLKKSYT